MEMRPCGSEHNAALDLVPGKPSTRRGRESGVHVLERAADGSRLCVSYELTEASAAGSKSRP